MNNSTPPSCANSSALSSNSVTIHYWDSSGDATKVSALTTAAITLCFIFLGLPSNLVIIAAILKKRLYKQPTYILLLNLAIVDFLLCLLVMPFPVMSGFAGEFFFGANDRIRCKVCQTGLFFVVFELVTLNLLTLISLDRLAFVIYPFKYHKMLTVSRTIAVVLVVWVFNLLISAIPLFGLGDVSYYSVVSFCVVKFTGKFQFSRNIYYPLYAVVISVFLLFVILFCNIWIACIVHKHITRIYNTKRISAIEEESAIQAKRRATRTKFLKQLQLFKVLFAVVATNIATWIPVIVCAVYAVLTNGTVPAAFNVTVFVILMSVGVVHPVIQASLIPELRQHILKLLHCNRKITMVHNSIVI